MAKSGYEIRLEILQLSAYQLSEEYNNKRSTIEQGVNHFLNSLTTNHMSTSKSSQVSKEIIREISGMLPESPTPEDTVSRAKTLYAFVQDGTS